MKIYKLLILVCLLISCTETKKEITKIKPFSNPEKIDELLNSISQTKQKYYVKSDKSCKVVGLKGTIIYVNPKNIEPIDGSILGDTIVVELMEFTDKFSLVVNNIQTVSDSAVLVTGGAYYINMTSNGKDLKIKDGLGLKVEFPILSDKEMELFLGERDSLGQINWNPTKQIFKRKEFKDPIKPKAFEKKQKRSYDIEVVRIATEDELLYDTAYSAPKVIKREDVSEEEYNEYLIRKAQYEKELEQIKYQNKTYEAIEILNFGWINCDRFYKTQNPLTNIEFSFNKDSITNARFYLIFEEINSVLTQYYWGDKETKVQFNNIPINMQVKIIGIGFNDSIPYWYNANINPKESNIYPVKFEKTTQKGIQNKILEYTF